MVIAESIERKLDRDQKRNRNQPIRVQVDKRNDKDDEPQFLAVEDLKALNWLCKYILNRAGAVTYQSVDDFRSRVMFPDESPLQAKARAFNECDLCNTGNIPGFNKEVEMYLLVSEFEKAGGPFFPPCMHQYLTTTVTFATNQFNLRANDYAKITELYFVHADRFWTRQCTKHGTALHKTFLKEMAPRYALQKQYDQEIRGENTYSARPGAGKKEEKSEDKGDGKLRDKWCDFHKACGHATKDCQYLNKVKKEAADQVRVNMTNVPAGANPLDVGMNPTRAYNNQLSDGKGQDDKPRRETVVCSRCSDVAGRPTRHQANNCYLDPKNNVPDSFNPRDSKIRAEANRLRKHKGLPNLVPRENTYNQTKVNLVRDCDGETPARVLMMRNRGEQDPTLGDWGDVSKPEDDLTFAAVSRTFVHTACVHGLEPAPLCARRQAPDGALLSISCVNCQTKWEASVLPESWTLPSIWLRTDELESRRQDAPLGMTRTDPTRPQLTAETLQFHQSAYNTSVGGNVSDIGLPSPRRREPVREPPRPVGPQPTTPRDAYRELSAAESQKFRTMIMDICHTGKSSYEAEFDNILQRLDVNRAGILHAQILRMHERYSASRFRSIPEILQAPLARTLFPKPIPESAPPMQGPQSPAGPALGHTDPRDLSPLKSEGEYSDIETASEPFEHTTPTVAPKPLAAVTGITAQLEQLKMSESSRQTRLTNLEGQVNSVDTRVKALADTVTTFKSNQLFEAAAAMHSGPVTAPDPKPAILQLVKQLATLQEEVAELKRQPRSIHVLPVANRSDPTQEALRSENSRLEQRLTDSRRTHPGGRETAVRAESNQRQYPRVRSRADLTHARG